MQLECEKYIKFWKRYRGAQAAPEIAATREVWSSYRLKEPNTCIVNAHKKCSSLQTIAQYGMWAKSDVCSEPSTSAWQRALCDHQNQTWMAADSECGEVCGYSPPQACEILGRGAPRNVSIVGDSLMRQLFQAMSCITNGDYVHGSMKAGASIKSLQKCSDDNQFNDKKCQGLVPTSSIHLPGPPCRAHNVTLHFTPVMSPFNTGAALLIKNLPPHGLTTTEKILAELKPDDIFIIGVGLWDNMEWDRYIKQYFSPMLKYMDGHKKTMPHVLAVLPHAVHVNMSYKGVTPQKVVAYNRKVGHFLQTHGVAFIDTVNISVEAARESYDGMHYVGSVNYLKASLILRHIESAIKV